MGICCSSDSEKPDSEEPLLSPTQLVTATKLSRGGNEEVIKKETSSAPTSVSELVVEPPSAVKDGLAPPAPPPPGTNLDELLQTYAQRVSDAEPADPNASVNGISRSALSAYLEKTATLRDVTSTAEGKKDIGSSITNPNPDLSLTNPKSPDLRTSLRNKRKKSLQKLARNKQAELKNQTALV